MKLEELLQKVSGEDVLMQFIDDTAIGARLKTDDSGVHTELVIYTTTNAYKPENIASNDGKFGILLWFDRDKYNELVKGDQK